ncbi:MAG: hypothetical protein QM630_07110 [Microbacterium sp.]
MAATGLLGCVGGDAAPTPPAVVTEGPRALTSDEAERLALVRFRNFDAGVRAVATSVVDAGVSYAISGWVDFASQLGYGRIEAAGEQSLLAWSMVGVATAPLPTGVTEAPLPPPTVESVDSGWISSSLAPDASRLHALLALIISVSSDRPDNPLLLQQTDARWLRSDEIDGVRVDVYAGPTSDTVYDPASGEPDDGSAATVRYWVDSGGLLVRLEAHLGGSGEWSTVDFAEAESNVQFAQELGSAVDSASESTQ